MNGQVQITPIDTFGWRIHRVEAAADVWYDMVVARPSSVRDCGVYSFYVKGLLHGTNLTTGQRVPDRVPGMFSCKLPGVIDAGIYRYAAQEPSEWWCVDRRFNGGELPPFNEVALLAGQFQAGKVLICSGPDVGKSFDGYTATQACYALTVDFARA